MPQLWSFSQLISYNFHQLASVIFRKYPNDYAQHVVSVDTIDRSIDPETGVLRTERIIGVQQPAPRWVSALLGSTAESYAREVTFIVPSTSQAEATSPPQILVSSINMSLKSVFTCYERISYTAFLANSLQEGAGQGVEMTTMAEMAVHGKLETGGVAARKIGRKMEDWTLDRYIANSQIGRRGLDSVLEKYFPDHQEEMAKGVE